MRSSQWAQLIRCCRPFGYAVGVLVLILALVLGVAANPPPGMLEPDGAPDRQSDGPRVPPPIVWPAPQLGTGPFKFESAVERNLRVVVVARGLQQPWSMAFLPDGDILVTERPGRLRIVRH